MEMVRSVYSPDSSEAPSTLSGQKPATVTLCDVESFVARHKRLPRSKINNTRDAAERHLFRGMKALYQSGDDLTRDRLVELGYFATHAERDHCYTQKLAAALQVHDIKVLKRKDRKIYDWMQRKRKEYGAGTLSPLIAEALKNLGVALDPSDEWKCMLAAAQDWVQGKKFEDGEQKRRIAAWVRNRRLDFRLNRLDPQRLIELESAGILTNEAKRKERLNADKWETAYQTVVDHYDPAMRYLDLLRVLPKAVNQWLKAQVSLLRGGKLSAERVSQLAQLGLPESFEVSTRKTLVAVSAFVGAQRRLPRCRKHHAVEYDLFCRLVALNVKRAEHPWLDQELQALSATAITLRDSTSTGQPPRAVPAAQSLRWHQSFDEIILGQDTTVLYKDLCAPLSPGQRKWLGDQIRGAKRRTLSKDKMDRLESFGLPETPEIQAEKLLHHLREFTAKFGHVPRKVHGDENEAVLARRLSKLLSTSSLDQKAISEIHLLYRKYPAPERRVGRPKKGVNSSYADRRAIR